MTGWQEAYLRNVREVDQLRALFSAEREDFDTWYQRHLEHEARLRTLKKENTALLSGELFPLLDRLHEASPEEIAQLTDFAGQLVDWKTNLDCGVFIAVHEALLKLYRHRRDRSGVIRELYQVGMGLFYLQRSLVSVDCKAAASLRFRNEMVFTEAASFFRYFETLDSDETRGYVIRSMANISISAVNYKRRIEASMRTIRTARDPAYRALAPDLPWDTYLRRGYQQLSTLRTQLSDPAITRTEVAAVMDACYEVFKPETLSGNSNRRWLWPYYDMEYHCGYVSLEVTLERLERLIRETRPDEYDMSGQYANLFLPIVYGRFLRDHEKLNRDPDRRRFLDLANRKMLQCLMSIPPEDRNAEFIYNVIVIVADYHELPESVSYREISTRLMQRFAGRLYLRSLQTGELLQAICRSILDRDPGYFDRLPILGGLQTDADRREALLAYAADCGLFHDFGLFKMNMERTLLTRTLFQNESEMYRLHPFSGYDDLRQRESTAIFADIARGHHTPYTGDGEDPSGYRRMDSPYRQMTDLVAMVSDLQERCDGAVDVWVRELLAPGQRRFSPRAAAFMADPALQAELKAILADDRSRCRVAYDNYYNV